MAGSSFQSHNGLITTCCSSTSGHLLLHVRAGKIANMRAWLLPANDLTSLRHCRRGGQQLQVAQQYQIRPSTAALLVFCSCLLVLTNAGHCRRGGRLLYGIQQLTVICSCQLTLTHLQHCRRGGQLADGSGGQLRAAEPCRDGGG